MKKFFNKIFSVKDKYSSVFNKLKDYTMIPKDVYMANLELAEKYSNIKGDIVECGTWKGGMIAGVALLLSDNRNYILFDSYEGLPPAKDIDGLAAKNWQSAKESEWYFDNCKASVEDAEKAMAISGVKNYSIKKGWFKKTLPSVNINNGIAILRMDADWYDSTFEILSNLFDKVNTGGVIIIDDYYFWEGCTKAVHDYLSINKRTEKIRSYKNICYIIKEV